MKEYVDFLEKCIAWLMKFIDFQWMSVRRYRFLKKCIDVVKKSIHLIKKSYTSKPELTGNLNSELTLT